MRKHQYWYRSGISEYHKAVTMTYHIKPKHNQYPYGETQIHHNDHHKKEEEEVETAFAPTIDTYWISAEIFCLLLCHSQLIVLI